MPDRSWCPLITAIGLFVLVLGMLFHQSIDASGEIAQGLHIAIGGGVVFILGVILWSVRSWWISSFPQRKRRIVRFFTFEPICYERSSSPHDRTPRTGNQHGDSQQKGPNVGFLGIRLHVFRNLNLTHLIYRKISATVGGNYLDIRGYF